MHLNPNKKSPKENDPVFRSTRLRVGRPHMKLGSIWRLLPSPLVSRMADRATRLLPLGLPVRLRFYMLRQWVHMARRRQMVVIHL
jgi:hypothetical protein